MYNIHECLYILKWLNLCRKLVAETASACYYGFEGPKRTPKLPLFLRTKWNILIIIKIKNIVFEKSLCELTIFQKLHCIYQ